MLAETTLRARATTFALVALLLALDGCKKHAPAPQGFGWMLDRTGNGSVLLIPSLHYARTDLRQLPRFVEGAILAADAIAIEYAPSDLSSAKADLAACPQLPEFATIPSPPLDQATAAAVQEFLHKRPVSEPSDLRTALDAHKAIGMALMKSSGVQPAYGIDSALLIAARNFSKPVYSLEKMCSSLEAVLTLAKSADNATVRAYLAGAETGALERVWLRMEEAWRSGDSHAACEAVEALVSTSSIEQRLFELLVTPRNGTLASAIIRDSSDGKALVVGVGMMHFCGERSLLSELAQRGVSVKLWQR